VVLTLVLIQFLNLFFQTIKFDHFYFTFLILILYSNLVSSDMSCVLAPTNEALV